MKQLILTDGNHKFIVVSDYSYHEGFKAEYQGSSLPSLLRLGSVLSFTDDTYHGEYVIISIEDSLGYYYDKKDVSLKECHKLYVTFANHSFVERQAFFMNQREKQGFDNSELWNLDYSLALIITSRLKAFKKDNRAEWSVRWNDKEQKAITVKPDDMLDAMIYAFSATLAENNDDELQFDAKKVKRGFKLFIKHFNDLWI